MKYYKQSKFSIKSMEGYGIFSDLDVALSNISDIYVYLDEEHRDSLKKDLRKFYYEETNADSWQLEDALFYNKDMVLKMIQEQFDKQKSKNINARKNMKYYRQASHKKKIRYNYLKRAGNDENIILIQDTLNYMNELIHLLSEKDKELDSPLSALFNAWLENKDNNRLRKILVHCSSLLAILEEELSNFTKNLSDGDAGKLYDLIQRELEKEQQN